MQLLKSFEKLFELDLVLATRSLESPADVEANELPALVLSDDSDKIGPSSHTTRLRFRTAAGFQIAVLFARQQKRDSRFVPSVEIRPNSDFRTTFRN